YGDTDRAGNTGRDAQHAERAHRYCAGAGVLFNRRAAGVNGGRIYCGSRHLSPSGKIRGARNLAVPKKPAVPAEPKTGRLALRDLKQAYIMVSSDSGMPITQALSESRYCTQTLLSI